MPAAATRSRPALRGALIVILAILVVWLVVATQLFYNVHPPQPTTADAVVVLGGASKERLPEALAAKAELSAPFLVISETQTKGNVTADQYCQDHDLDPQVICFLPDPMDTRGEATAVGELVAEHGWTSIVVVTSKYHVARSQRLMNQCTSSNVQMIATDPQLSAAKWLRRLVIETGGLLSVTLNPECDSP